MKHSNISIFISHMGCPNCCSFCNQRIISSTKIPPTADEVKEILSDAVPKLSNPHDTEIAFFGGSFTAIERGYMISLLEAAKPFLPQLMGIRISTRPDCIDDEVLSVLKSYGVTSIELGAQSMVDEVLTANNRGHKAEDVRKASALIKSYGFELGLQMMTGLYKSSPADELYTAEEIISLAPKTVRIYPVVILGGTKLADLYQNGVFHTYGIEEMADICGELLKKFAAADITVIKLGLHSSEEVEGEMIGGYYHPAFAEIVRSILFRKCIEKHTLGDMANVTVSKQDRSCAVGQHKSNMVYFAEHGVGLNITESSSLKRDMLIINGITASIME